jgi:N4-gp56 family major capsid protein
MALQSLLTPAQRIGKMKGEVLRHAIPREVLSLACIGRPMPRNSGDTVVFRRWLPVNATTTSPNVFFADGTGDRATALANQYLASEGITPNAESLVPQDITVTLNEYSVLFGYTKRVADLYEDDVPSAMKAQVGERIGLVRELVRFGVIKGSTNKFYGGTGTSRATVNGRLTLNMLRKITKSLDAQHGEKITEILEPSTKISTKAIEASFLVFIHTDLKPDVRDIPGFTPVAQYGSRQPISPYEFGSVEEFRIIASPELVSVQDSGAAVGTTGMYSTSNSNLDVYQVVVTAKDAWGEVALRGAKSLEIYDIKPGQIDKTDPTGQRGYLGGSTYFSAVLLNSMHCAVAEVASKVLSD